MKKGLLMLQLESKLLCKYNDGNFETRVYGFTPDSTLRLPKGSTYFGIVVKGSISLEYSSRVRELMEGDFFSVIVRELLRQKVKGLIWTTGFPKAVGAEEFYREVENLLLEAGGTIQYVKLICSEEEQKRRVVQPGRKKYDKPNTVESLQKKGAVSTLDFFALAPVSEALCIDNTHVSAKKVTEQIMSRFDIQNT